MDSKELLELLETAVNRVRLDLMDSVGQSVLLASLALQEMQAIQASLADWDSPVCRDLPELQE